MVRINTAKEDIRFFLEQVKAGAMEAADAVRALEISRLNEILHPRINASSVMGFPKWTGGISGAPGAAAGQGPGNGAPGTATATATVTIITGQGEANGEPGTAAAGQRTANGTRGSVDLPDNDSDAWKHKVLFLNARLGVSNRYFLSKGVPDALIFTGDAGIEGEVHPFNFFALQFGANYAMDWDPRVSSPLSGTYIVSIPFMAKFLLNTSKATTLGIYGGGYANFPILGKTTPPPFGVLAGLDLAVHAGPGAVLFDIRYSADMGNTDAEDDKIESYNRMFLTFSAGYKIGFIKRKARF
jgi:hypothetical protein